MRSAVAHRPDVPRGPNVSASGESTDAVADAHRFAEDLGRHVLAVRASAMKSAALIGSAWMYVRSASTPPSA